MRNPVLGAAIAALLSVSAAAAQDCGLDSAEAGERIFKRCKACHSLEPGKNGIGPTLSGVVGRAVAGVPDFDYSDAMKAHGEGGVTWAAESLSTYLENPQEVVPGTTMAFVGLPKPEDRRDLVCYLAGFN